MTEREENNRILAEWLEGMPKSSLPPIRRDIRDGQEIGGTEKIGIRTDGSYYAFPKYWFMGASGWYPRDFYTDETANAMLLEKMPEPQVWLESNAGDDPKIWGCWPDMGDDGFTSQLDRDRKTAIVNAALALIARPA